MKGCSAQDGDLEWSDSCTWLLPAHPCRFEISSHPTSSKNTVTRAGNSSSWPSINPNTLRFLLLSCSAATILSPSSTFYCCRLYHLHCPLAYSCTVALCPWLGSTVEPRCRNLSVFGLKDGQEEEFPPLVTVFLEEVGRELISKRQGLAGSNQVQLSDHLRLPSWSEQPFIRNW